MTHYHPNPAFAGRAEPRNGMGVTALVLGLCGVVVGCIPLVGFFGFIAGLLGSIFGAIGISRAGRGVATNKSMAITGLVLSLGAVVVSTAVFASFASSVSKSVPLAAEPTLSSLPTATAPVAAGAPVSSFGDGVWEVGMDIAPGKYKTTGPDGFNCYYARLKTGDGSIGDILVNNNVSGPATIVIKGSDGYFESNGCSPWVKAD